MSHDKKIDPLETFRKQVLDLVLASYPTIEQFCWDNDLSKATLSNLINNKKDFQISTLIKIAKALDKDLVIQLK